MAKMVEINPPDSARCASSAGSRWGFGPARAVRLEPLLVFRHLSDAAREPVAFTLLGLGVLSAAFSAGVPQGDARSSSGCRWSRSDQASCFPT